MPTVNGLCGRRIWRRWRYSGISVPGRRRARSSAPLHLSRHFSTENDDDDDVAYTIRCTTVQTCNATVCAHRLCTLGSVLHACFSLYMATKPLAAIDLMPESSSHAPIAGSFLVLYFLFIVLLHSVYFLDVPFSLMVSLIHLYAIVYYLRPS